MKTLSYPRLIDHPDEIASLLRAVIGARIRLVNCRVINQDEDYSVLFARLSQPDIEVVVKLAGPDYLQRRPIYQLLWCLEYARSTPEHLADTQRVCHELGISVIDSFD